MADDNDDDVTGVGRYGGDMNALRRILQKKRVLSELKPASSSSSSDSSSSSSSSSSSDEENESSNEGGESDARIQLERRLAQRIAQTTSSVNQRQTFTVDDPVTLEIKKLKSDLASTIKERPVDIDEDSESDEAEIRASKKPRIKYAISSEEESSNNEEKELGSEEEDSDSEEEGADGSNAEEVEDEDDEDEQFFIKFSFEKGVKLPANPDAPFKEVFDKFMAKFPPVNGKQRKFVFKFDGETLRENQTPADVGMDSGDQVDVKEK